MTAELRVVINDTGEILKIPNQALLFRPNGHSSLSESTAEDSPASRPEGSATAWVVGSDGRPLPVALRLGVSDDISTQLLAGALTEGQPVIIGIARSHAGFFGIRLGF
jgi:HlyD family secretion protein